MLYVGEMRSLSRVLRSCAGRAALRSLFAFAVAMSVSGVAYAGDTSTAEHLFQQGLDAMKKNQFKEACDAFAGSNEADPSPGTQINLALCNEKQNKLASAWGWYRTASGLADQRGQKERADLARGEAVKLEPKLHKLVINVKTPAEGMTVTRNGAPVPQAVLGTDVPIDPGDHAIEVAAKGKKPWKHTVHIAAAPGVDRLEVPALEDAPAEATAAPAGTPGAGADYRAPATGGNDGSTQRTIGFVVGGAGILAMVTAAGVQIFNLAVTESQYKDVERQFTANKCDSTTGRTAECPGIETSLENKDNARDSNQLAAIVVGATGGAMLITGIVLLVTAPSAKSSGSLSRPLVLPLVGRDSAGFSLSASF